MSRNLFVVRVSLLAVSTLSAVCAAEVVLPEGTRIPVRLEQSLNSATAEVNQHVQLAVSEDIMVSGVVALRRGTAVDGKVVTAVPKRRMGRTGKLDFSIDDIIAPDGTKIPLRYSPVKKNGGSHAVRTGVITAGVAVVFWPAAPFMLLMHGKDANFNQGMTFEVFTNSPYAMKAKAEPVLVTSAKPAATTAVTITSDSPGAEIEVDGAFAANTPSTLQLAPGNHVVRVSKNARSWQRAVSITSGDSLSLTATLEEPVGGQQ